MCKCLNVYMLDDEETKVSPTTFNYRMNRADRFVEINLMWPLRLYKRQIHKVKLAGTLDGGRLEFEADGVFCFNGAEESEHDFKTIMLSFHHDFDVSKVEDIAVESIIVKDEKQLSPFHR